MVELPALLQLMTTGRLTASADMAATIKLSILCYVQAIWYYEADSMVDCRRHVQTATGALERARMHQCSCRTAHSCAR